MLTTCIFQDSHLDGPGQGALYRPPLAAPARAQGHRYHTPLKKEELLLIAWRFVVNSLGTDIVIFWCPNLSFGKPSASTFAYGEPWGDLVAPENTREGPGFLMDFGLSI